MYIPSEDTVAPVMAFLSTKNNSLSVFSATIPLQLTFSGLITVLKTHTKYKHKPITYFTKINSLHTFLHLLKNPA